MWEGVRKRMHRKGRQSRSTVYMCKIFKRENKKKEELREKERLDDLMLTQG